METKKVEIMNNLKSITIFEHLETHGDIFETKERRFAFEAEEDSDSDVSRNIRRQCSLPYELNAHQAAHGSLRALSQS